VADGVPAQALDLGARPGHDEERAGAGQAGVEHASGALGFARLTAWMDEHLAVIPVPIADAGTLGVVEEAVLARLDPPLNLQHMPRTPLRRELSRLRKVLGSMPDR
jgi:hypothetical protein